jgi:Rod binding domain-containing protein
MSEINPRVGSALDFQGLGELRGQAQRDQRGALRETARQFEAMFLQTIMATMREAGFKSDLVESSAMDTFQSMHDKEIALAMTRRGGIGLADMMVDQMERNQMVPAAQALAARTANDGMKLTSDQAAGGFSGRSGLVLDPVRPARPLLEPVRSFDLPQRPGEQSFALTPRGLPFKPARGPDR